MKPLSLIILLLGMQAKAQEYFLLVGTYTDKSSSKGIHVYRFNSADGSFSEAGHIAAPNASYLAVSPDQRFVYAVHEVARNGNGGEIASFSFDKGTGRLSFVNKQLSGGDHPCYVEIDRSGKWLFAGNYSSGSLSVLPVRPDGSLDSASSHIQHTGNGPDKRQAGPHVHCTLLSPDNRFLYVPDLGIDKVMIYAFEPVSGQLRPGPQPYISLAPGEGPRHITFHPNGQYAYLITELGSHVAAYYYKKGSLTLLQQLSNAEPEGYAASADIHVSPDGRFLYASNRAPYNNIAIFKIDTASGKLDRIGFQSSLGSIPRNFSLDPTGRFLLVANQESNDIIIFKRDMQTGLLTDTGRKISIGKPVCLKWISAD